MQNEFFTLQQQNGRTVLCLSGDWTITHFVLIKAYLKKHSLFSKELSSVDLEQISNLDTSGVYLLASSVGSTLLKHALNNSTSLHPERIAMIDAVLAAMPTEDDKSYQEKKYHPIRLFLGHVSLFFVYVFQSSVAWLAFFGLVIAALAKALVRPRQWRLTALVANMDESGFKALPIVMLLCFMVGAVVAFLGASTLQNFGAKIFTVHLVTYSFLREFAILLTAILIAGRTASAYTAQLGSMKVNEEIDALKAMGANPIEVLVVPRVLALLFSMPLLTFLGMVAGIGGGMLVASGAMDISPRLFFDVINNSVHVKHFLVGMVKAPVFSIVIAITGCLEGFRVSGSAESVGRHTTISVVKCIFLVILLDAIFAIFFMEMGW